MQVIGILQLPMFLGPKFSPFGLDILNPWKDSSTWNVGRIDSQYGTEHPTQPKEKTIAKAKKNNKNFESSKKDQ